MYEYMSPLSFDREPFHDAWEELGQPTDRLDVRIRVFSEISYQYSAMGAGSPQEMPQSAPHPEEPERAEYEVDGEVLIFRDRIFLRYAEHPATGLGQSITVLHWWRDKPDAIDLTRRGDTKFYVSLDSSNPHQSITYQNPFGVLESQLTLVDLYNLTENGIGRIFFAYNMNFMQTLTAHTVLRFDIRRASKKVPEERRKPWSEKEPHREALGADLTRLANSRPIKQAGTAESASQPTEEDIERTLEEIYAAGMAQGIISPPDDKSLGDREEKEEPTSEQPKETNADQTDATACSDKPKKSSDPSDNGNGSDS